jgi:hypothetical protein
MNPTYADDPADRGAVQALRAAGAQMCEVDGRFYCEVRSTLRAMGVSRKAGLRRIVDSGTPLYQRFSRRSGAGVLVTDAEAAAAIGDGRGHRYDAEVTRGRIGAFASTDD